MKRTLSALLMMCFVGASIGGCKKDAAPAPAATGGAPAAGAPAGGAAPAAGGTAPAAGGGGSCDAYQKCCDALSKTPNGGALTGACASIASIKGSPAADQACSQGLAALKQAATAMGPVPADCN